MLERLIVYVEEFSMEVALEYLLPEIIGEIDFEIRRFQCKHDLLKKLPLRLKGFSSWLPETWAILVLVDLDDEDCLLLKQQLEDIAANAGLITKSTAGYGNKFQVVNRIAIEELEAWFFGDWSAVQAAYPRVSESVPRKEGYRNPDAIAGGTWEAIERIMKHAGYFKGGLRKLELAREVAQHMNPSNNKSHSFNAFKEAVEAAVAWI